MTKTYFPFDAGAGANVTEAQWADMATLWRDTGVHPTLLNKLETFADSTGMQVKVKSGVAWVEGFYFKSNAQETLAIAASDPSNPRIDRVIVQLDRVNNIVDLKVLTGTPAASPVAPTLTQTSMIWEISLAQVLVGTGVTTIAAGNVTDERGYSYPGEATATPTASKIPIADDDGTLAKWGAKSRVRAYLATAVQSLANITWTKILLNAENYDGLSEFDPVTNYRFTATAAGYYLVVGTINLQSPADQQWVVIDIRKNNVSTGQAAVSASGIKNIVPLVSNILYLVANDYLELWAYQDAGVAKNVGYGSEVTYLCIHRLS